MQHGQHGDVGLACTCWSCYEEVFIGVVCCIKDHTLDPVQTLGAYVTVFGKNNWLARKSITVYVQKSSFEHEDSNGRL